MSTHSNSRRVGKRDNALHSVCWETSLICSRIETCVCGTSDKMANRLAILPGTHLYTIYYLIDSPNMYNSKKGYMYKNAHGKVQAKQLSVSSIHFQLDAITDMVFCVYSADRTMVWSYREQLHMYTTDANQ